MHYKWLVFFVVFPILLRAQDGKGLLAGSYRKCLSLTGGTYRHTQLLATFETADTVRDIKECVFKRSFSDTLFACYFHNKWYHDGKYFGDRIYTGKELVSFNDSIAEVTEVRRYHEYLTRVFRGYVLYGPLQREKNNPFSDDAFRFVSDKDYSDLGSEMKSGYYCRHIRVTRIDSTDYSVKEKGLSKTLDFWINMQDSVLIGYSSYERRLLAGDTVWFYSGDFLDSYDFKQPVDDSVFSLARIPRSCKMQDFVLRERNQPLKLHAQAPGWSARSINRNDLEVGVFKGKMILIDFFFQSCFPCARAYPALNRLYRQYGKRGLLVAGLDPFDKDEQKLLTFTRDRSIHYPVIKDCMYINDLYHVSVYPTIYLISKDGTILYASEGYEEGDDKKIEAIIFANINQ